MNVGIFAPLRSSVAIPELIVALGQGAEARGMAISGCSRAMWSDSGSWENPT